MEDFNWISNLEISLFEGEKYDIKSYSGFWLPFIVIDYDYDEEYSSYYYSFESLLDENRVTNYSEKHVRDLIKNGMIREHVPNEKNITDQLNKSNNIKDVLKGNFTIYFKGGVYLDETIDIQKKLFDMGFSFFHKKINEFLTNLDFSDKIVFIESYDWDTSIPRYSSMPSDQRTNKKLLITKYNASNTRDEEQLFSPTMIHNAILINGNHLINNNLNENFDWVSDINVNPKLGELLRNRKIKKGDVLILMGDLSTEWVYDFKVQIHSVHIDGGEFILLSKKHKDFLGDINTEQPLAFIKEDLKMDVISINGKHPLQN